MKRLVIIILTSLCWTLSFAGTPGHETIVHCNEGCILVRQVEKEHESVICARTQYIKIVPDTDNMYRLTIFSGYPLGQAKQSFSVPRYKQDYVWSEDYYRVSVDVNNCLRHQEIQFFPLEVIGVCPPAEYHDKNPTTNPYNFFYGLDYKVDSGSGSGSDSESSPFITGDLTEDLDDFTNENANLPSSSVPVALSLQDDPAFGDIFTSGEDGGGTDSGLGTSDLLAFDTFSSANIFTSNEDEGGDSSLFSTTDNELGTTLSFDSGDGSQGLGNEIFPVAGTKASNLDLGLDGFYPAA